MTDLPTPATPGTDSRLIRRALQAGILGSALAEQALVLLREGGDGCAFLVAQGALTASQVELLRGGSGGDALDGLGEFVLREVIGKGGMGVVYRAVQSSLQREVALKVLAGSLADDPLFRERFIREAKVAASISSSHVVTCYAAGSDQHRLYLAMELMPGGDVERLVLQQAGTLPEAKALAIARDAALGLEAIHQAGLVHRDIKPANLLLDRDGRAKIGDLGLTRPPHASGVTGPGAVPGTPSFMAPEQICNDPTLDARADIYALGATLFFLLTGRPPFTGSSHYAVVHQAVNESIPDPRLTRPGISAAAAAIVVRAGARDRTQ
ncbi:MAG: serine/threonine protein kinase, partial [Planctomycetes bacterium]|nr:serine/threonine protein kinase [Planctomycetota bacterium]